MLIIYSFRPNKTALIFIAIVFLYFSSVNSPKSIQLYAFSENSDQHYTKDMTATLITKILKNHMAYV